MADPDYFTLSAFRTLPEMNDTTTYTEAKVLAAAAHFTSIIEREVGTSFVARTVTDEVHDGGVAELILNHPYVQSVTSATENGTTVTDTLSVSHNGLVQRFASGSYTPKAWRAGSRNLRITYQAGYSATPPGDIKDALMWATRDRLISQAADNVQDPRQSSMTNDLGGSTTFVLPGEKRPTGYPELDALIASYKRTTSPFGPV